ncbi:transaldolase family protein [Salibacter halophilus]|jgi:TalC/MipB family fructose-6-phosphate aldolase|uniref:CBS domain-containing protein n=1 Tax=Salibacter halophilus TaxID=1803916 RepID=A0A6N6M254_9FLAO|nr:transaldolase family protein [Salibacter halophilus]KAB1062848.1 CBS domain-containing protein [Salibacter halophilus]
MELYLDSADINEIKHAFKLGFLSGLTTTPTFMHRHGITDIDGTIVELSKIVPVLQIEALGETAEEIVAEAKRQEKLGLDRETTVYKIPISMEGVKACKELTDQGFKVNIHLVYTLQQAYMAMQAGATYVCPLVGRLQDQGTDALSLVEQCVDAVNYYGYNTKIMFSSVRHVEHVRNAINVGVHTITVPWKVMKQLTENHFTEIGTRQFFEHTRLMTVRVKDIMNDHNPMVEEGASVTDCTVKMTSGGFGAVSVVNDKQEAIGIFTDGDLRRLIETEGASAVNKRMSELNLSKPLSVDAESLLIDAQSIFTEKKIDELVVTKNDKVVGMLDVQDIVKMNS